MIRPSSILLHLDLLDCPSLRLIEFMNQFRHLPLPEALAPNGIPTLLWKHFKLELGPILYGNIRHIGPDPLSTPQMLDHRINSFAL